MFDTLATLQSEVHRMLGHLDAKYLSPEDTTAAAIEALAFYGLEAQQSRYARSSKYVEFFPTSRNAPVNKASDMAVPSYVERKIGNAPNERWQWIPATHPSLLAENEALRCAWERDSDGRFRLLFNYDPTGMGPYRLHYYSDPVIAQALTDPLGFPARYGFLLTHETILNVVTTVMNRSEQLPEAERLTSGQLNAISAQVGHSQAQVEKWRALWTTEKQADRAPRGRNRKRILGGVRL